MRNQNPIKNDIDSIDIINIVKRGSLVIIMSIIVTVTVAFFATKVFIKPIYEARTKMLIKEEKLNPKEDFPTYKAELQFAHSQAVIITSKSVITRALEKIDFSDVALNGIDRQSFEKIDLKSSINLRLLDNTNIFDIKVEQENPLFAAMLANALAEIYIEDRVKLRSKTVERIISSLEKEIEAAEKDFTDIEKELDEMTIKEGMIMLPGSDIALDLKKYADIDHHLTYVNADIEMLDTKLIEIKKRIEETDHENVNFKFIFNIPVINDLKSQIRMAELRLDVLMGQFNVNHPEVIVAQAAIDKLKIDLSQESNMIAKAEIEFLKIERASLIGKKNILLETQGNQTQRLTKVLRIQPKLARFNRDIAMKRKIYSDLTEKLQALKILKLRTSMLPDAEIIEFADVPDSPIKPNLLKNLLLGGLVGLIIGFGMALALSISSGEEVKAEQDSPQVTERRSSPRTETYNKVMCTVVGEKREYDCWGKNIGRSGMKIITNKKLQRNNILKFEIHCNKMKPIVGNGIVVWSSPVSVGGISEYAAGVKFYDLELDINNDIA